MATPLTLMEEYRGTGRIEAGETSFAGVEYEISRYQGLAASGHPRLPLHFDCASCTGRVQEKFREILFAPLLY